ncbi:MAG: hypothetical protein LBM02_10030 [Lachnospiraceae bacterium]|jgi:hypothetical protein|nr:hypothetical protein [Lachnospiraceae bacterium]
MALHSSDNRHLGVSPFGSVMTDGYSLDLGLDQAGIFSKSARKTTQKGLKALSTFEGIDKAFEKIAILYGSKKTNSRTGSDKSSRTVDFALNQIKHVGISHPKQKEQKVDYWRVGWDGVHDETSLKFTKGQTVELSMTLGGTPVGFFNSSPFYTVKVPISIPNEDGFGPCGELGGLCDPVDCREHTLKLVKDLNDTVLPSIGSLGPYLEAWPIFSEPDNSGKKIVYKQWCLDYCGFGGTHELSAVSAQYPGVKIARDTMSGRFSLFAPEDYTPAPFKQTHASILKGCEDCPAGYDTIDGGFVYAIALEDDGEDKTSVVSGLPNAVASSVIKTGQDYGVGHYIVVLSKKLKAEDEKTFVTANPTATLLAVGTKDAFCKNADIVETAWVECSQCSATEATYRILIPDDCKGSRLEELKEAYPDLTITQVSSQNCVSLFETKVMTDFSCVEGCSPAIIEQVFKSEAPKPFGVNRYWFPAPSAKSEAKDVKCGFEIKAKPVILSASECTIEDLPFIATSIRIVSLAGGYPMDYSLNNMIPEGQWSILQLERAQDLDNLGGNLRGWEQRGTFYFRNEKPWKTVVERELTGTQTKLDNLTQYSDLFVTVEGSNKAGINDKEYTYITYHILVPYGRTSDLEKVFQNLAGAAGLPFEVK